MEMRGGFSACELSTVEKDTFADYLQHSMNSPALEFIKYLLGDDYLKFIDVMSGTVLKIPSAKALNRDLESVRIFLYVKKRGFTEISIKEAAKLYGKSVITARRYALKVSKVLGIEDTLDGDDLNNYVLNVKSAEDKDSYYQTKAESRRESIRKKRKELEEGNIQELESGLESEQVSTVCLEENSVSESSNTEIMSEIVESSVYVDSGVTLGVSIEEPREIEDTVSDGVATSEGAGTDCEDKEDDRYESLKEFIELNSRCKYVDFVKTIYDMEGYSIEPRLNKSGSYMRVMKGDKHVADCTVGSRSGWKVYIRFSSDELREDAMKSLSSYNPKYNGKSFLLISRVTSKEDLITLIKVGR